LQQLAVFRTIACFRRCCRTSCESLLIAAAFDCTQMCTLFFVTPRFPLPPPLTTSSKWCSLQERRLQARRTINTGGPSWRFFGTDSRVLRSGTYRAPSPEAFLAIKVCPPWGGRLLPALVVHRKPDRRLVWCCPGYPVLRVGRDVEVVAGLHLD